MRGVFPKLGPATLLPIEESRDVPGKLSGRPGALVHACRERDRVGGQPVVSRARHPMGSAARGHPRARHGPPSPGRRTPPPRDGLTTAEHACRPPREPARPQLSLPAARPMADRRQRPAVAHPRRWFRTYRLEKTAFAAATATTLVGMRSYHVARPPSTPQRPCDRTALSPRRRSSSRRRRRRAGRTAAYEGGRRRRAHNRSASRATLRLAAVRGAVSPRPVSCSIRPRR